MEKTVTPKRDQILIPDPPFARDFFQTTRYAWLWLALRVYLGYGWLASGWAKVGNPAWRTGSPLRGFWENAARIPEAGRPTIAFDWYRDFIRFMLENRWYEWFAELVMLGELLVGLALVVGAFTGIAAFAGGFMNWNFIMAGAASTNGLMLTLAVVLILAWKVAGWFGLDRWLLPRLGTPWSRGAARVPNTAPD